MRSIETRSGKKLGVLVPLVLTASSCTISLPSLIPDPVFSITTDTMSISEAGDGLSTVRLTRPACLVSSTEHEQIVVTYRFGGTTKESDGFLWRLVGGVFKFIMAIF